MTPHAAPDVVRAFTPTGVLRASINLGNPILAARDPQGGPPRGVSVDLARAFAQQLGVGLDLVVFDTAGASVEAVSSRQADIGFFAIDPKRGEQITFTPPYVLIEGVYLVAHDSPLQANEEVDQAGHKVVVGRGSAYDLFLTRELKHASIERAPSSPAVVEHFLACAGDVAAGVRQQLEMDLRRHHGLRLLPGRFMQIRQAMGCPTSYGPAAAQALAGFIEAMKASGFVGQALARHGIEGVSIAPAQPVGSTAEPPRVP